MFYMIIKTISAWHPIVWIVSTMSIFAIRKIISHMSIVKYGEKTDAIQCATIKRLKRNIDGRMEIGGSKIFTSRVWGRHAPARALQKRGSVAEVQSRRGTTFSRIENLWPRDGSCSQLIRSKRLLCNCFQIIKTQKWVKNFFLLKWWCSRWAPPLFRFIFLANRYEIWYIGYTKHFFDWMVCHSIICKERCYHDRRNLRPLFIR